MITKIHESVFPLPIHEDAVRRQIVAMGRRYIGANGAHKMPELSLRDFLARQDLRQHLAERGVK